MYKLFDFNEDSGILNVTLPQGRTMAELTRECSAQIHELILQKRVFGKDVSINGRITTSMALVLGHELSHVCRSVSIYDPKEDEYFECIKH